LLDRRADSRIGAAAADRAGHGGVDIGIVRLWRGSQQSCSAHNLTGLAISTLHYLQIQPRVLYFRPCRRLADSLDRHDLFPGDRNHRHDARSNRLTVDMHRADAALGNATAELRAGQTQNIPKNPEQWHVLRHIDFTILPIDVQYENDQDATSYRRIPKTQRTTSTVNGTPSSQRMNPFPMMASPFLIY
jgi:hypothetical protein